MTDGITDTTGSTDSTNATDGTDVALGASGLRGSRVVLGAMRIAALGDGAIRDLVRAARDAGVTMIDHADLYGGEPHACERRFGESGAVPAGERDRVVIQSKVGIRPGRYDSSRAHILTTVDGSLAALRTDHLDVLLLHRPDALVEPEEVAAAFDALHTAGKVREFGVSNHAPGQIALLQRWVTRPLVVNQMQLSLAHAAMVAQGMAANVAGEAQALDRDGGVLDHCRLHDLTVQAWAPFQSPTTGRLFLGDRDAYPELVDALADVAAAHGVSPSAVAVAWITRHPARMQVVVGSTNPARVADAARGAAVRLRREEWYRLFTAAGNVLP